VALTGKTANVDQRVLAFADRVAARAGLASVNVASGRRAGSQVFGYADRASLHASGLAVDLGTYYGPTLTRLGQAALVEAGMPAAQARTKRAWSGATVGGWEIIFNSWEGGDHFDHLHLGLEGGGVTDHRTPSGGALSTQQLAELWKSQGGQPRQASMAAAVASLESGGRPRARNLSRIEDSRGLWQINVRAHPTWRLRDLYNPRVNAQAAIAISRNGRDWSPWTTASRARAALTLTAGKGGVIVQRPGGDPLGGLGDVGGAVTGAAGTVWDSITGGWRQVTGWGEALVAGVGFLTNPSNWLRLLEVVTGFILLLTGLGILVLEFTKGSSGGAASGARQAAGLLPTGRALTLAGKGRAIGRAAAEGGGG
jgi:hypothetical protein